MVPASRTRLEMQMLFFFEATLLVILLVPLSPQAQTDPSAEARQLQQQAAELRTKGNPREAIPLLRKALELLKQHAGPNTTAVGDAANLLGVALFQAGMYGEAAAEFDVALSIRRKTDEAAVAQTLNNLANAVRGLGNLVRAEQLLLESLGLQEKLRGANDIEVVRVLTNLGSLYDARGDFSRGEPMYSRALGILRARDLRPDDALLATVVSNLGLLYQNRGDLEEARPLLEQSLQLREKLLADQPDHPQIARALMNLATNYQESGKLDNAESLYKRALGIFTKRSELETLPVATLSVNLAMIHLLRGEYERAEPLYKRSLEIREKSLGPSHPDTGAALERLAVFYQVTDRRSDALAAIRRAVEVAEQNLKLTIAAGSELQKVSYMDTLQENTDILLSMRQQFGVSDPQDTQLSVATIIQRKGRVLDALVDVNARLRESVSPGDQATFDELSKARTELANLVQSGSRLPPNEHAAQVEKLRTAIDRLEQKLSNSSPQLRGEVESVTIESVSGLLPARSALVEFVKYRPFDPKAIGRFNRFGPPRYAAFVLHGGKHSWVELGAAEDIERAATAWRTALRSPRDGGVREKGRAVYERLLSPLVKDIGDADHLFVVPDDVLNLLPFSALTATDNRYLVETRGVTYLASSRDLLRFAKGPAPREPALIIAAPEFAAGGKQSSPSTSFEPLPGAAREGKAIARIVPRARFVEGRAASESFVKRMHGPAIVHFATHAFFVGPSQPRAKKTSGDSSRTVTQVGRVTTDPAPLLRAGIALAGAGSIGEGGEDGVLTALETASLDLRGTKLVVLSACETGIGDVRAGDGIYGFRRALTLAGAESQVLTLWRVDDATSADLMAEDHRALRKGYCARGGTAKRPTGDSPQRREIAPVLLGRVHRRRRGIADFNAVSSALPRESATPHLRKGQAAPQEEHGRGLGHRGCLRRHDLERW